MKRSFLFLLLAISLSAQDKPDGNVSVEQEKHGSGGGMDKDYYNFYFETRPDKRASETAKLEANLVRVFRDEIERKDHKVTSEYLAQVKPPAMTYEKVTEDSIWVRGIRDIFRDIKYTKYMYIVKYDKYYAFISFVMDPGAYIQTPYQAEVLFKKENVFMSSPANP